MALSAERGEIENESTPSSEERKNIRKLEEENVEKKERGNT
jgi:hypothetical protein